MSDLSEGIQTILSGNAFANAFWVFVGIVAGAVIQHLLGLVTIRKQKSNAKRLFRVETAINRSALDSLKNSVVKKKERFVSGQQTDQDFFIDMSSFNYRIVDPLINAGYFHEFLGPEGVARYFRYANELNVNNAQNLVGILRQEAEAGRSLNFLDWLIDTKLPEWDGHLSLVENKLGGNVIVNKIEYTVPKGVGKK